MTSAQQILPLRLISFIALFTSCLVFQPQQAAAGNRLNKDSLPWYEIEVIVFANTQQSGLDTETWPNNPPMKEFSQVVTLDFPQGGGVPRDDLPDFAKADYRSVKAAAGGMAAKLPEPFVFLGRNEFRLGDVMSKLQSDSRYQPLLHIAWRQPTLSPKAAPPVFVYSGMDTPSNSGLVNTGFQMVGPQSVKLYGLIRLSVSRYLHVETDLHYRTPVMQQQYVLEEGGSGFFGGSSEPQEKLVQRKVLLDFRMHESRRMRSKEIHFFDHPMFGMIVTVTPYEFSGG